MIKNFTALILFLFFNLPQINIPISNTNNHNPPFLQSKTPWADSLIKTMTLDEKIGQLFMIAAYSNKNEDYYKKLEQNIKKYKIGALIFFQGTPQKQIQLINRYNKLSKIPLMIGIDAEWGLGMRLDSTINYPWQMTIGATRDDSLVYEMGKQIAMQCKRTGININFAPVVDINSNPDNPIINARSFGENKKLVTKLAIAYMKGLQDENILATAKHFPGHGDTDKDSHKTLPEVNFTKARIDTVELYPYKKMIKKGLSAIMVAHIYIPAIDSTPNLPATLSKKVVKKLLKEKLSFTGLTFTDALTMQGALKYYEPGIVEVKALQAGNDILLFPKNLDIAIKEIKKAIKKGLLKESDITKKCLKILRAKEWLGLNKKSIIDTTNVYNDLHKREYELLLRQIYKKSLTLLINRNSIVPLIELENKKIASISIGGDTINNFQKTLNLYAPVKNYHLPYNLKTEDIKNFLDSLKNYNLIIVSIHTPKNTPYYIPEINENINEFLSGLTLQANVILTFFANAYGLKSLRTISSLKSLLLCYEDNKITQELAAQLIFGGIKAQGKLPVSVLPYFKYGDGINTNKIIRFEYTIPEDLGINSEYLKKIDSIVYDGIKNEAFPGCQILIAKNQKVFYHKAFGYFTYDKKQKVKLSNLYDLASITKISATLPSIMKLYDEGKFDINKTLGYYLAKELDSTDKFNLNIKEILAHQSGLPAWIPFYLKTIAGGYPRYDIYSLVQNETYPYQVANNLYIRKDYPDTMMKIIIKTPVHKEKKYLYSDLGFYFFKQIIEKITGTQLNKYVENTFYKPLGCTTTTYLPLLKFNKKNIVPTENDNYFRHQLIQGYVHDPGAAMLGGVGGHAGVFSNANDLAKIMQMYLNKGTYGGKRYINDSTIMEFTKCQFCDEGNRRGIGFDKPAINGEEGPTCNCASYESFGHTGFTGTIAWADPKSKLIYIFLSNRVYPSAENKKLIEMNIRTKIQEIIYKAISECNSNK